MRDQPLDARAFSIVVRLSCRKNAISDELNAVRAREVACFRLREEVEAVSECVLPPAFKFAAMFVSQRSERFCGRRQFGRPWLARLCGAADGGAAAGLDESFRLAIVPPSPTKSSTSR